MCVHWIHYFQEMSCSSSLENSESNAHISFFYDHFFIYFQLFGNYSSIVWSTPLSLEERLLALSDEHFLSELQQAFTKQLPRVTNLGLDMERFLPYPRLFLRNYSIGYLPSFSDTPKPPKIEKIVGQRMSFPLRVTHASEYVRQRVALIG